MSTDISRVLFLLASSMAGSDDGEEERERDARCGQRRSEFSRDKERQAKHGGRPPETYSKNLILLVLQRTYLTLHTLVAYSGYDRGYVHASREGGSRWEKREKSPVEEAAARGNSTSQRHVVSKRVQRRVRTL